jgi:predicted enzyme related to lactoylglutathione lyase
MSSSPKPGDIGWIDLTTADAERQRDFYSAVIGWSPQPVDMGGYADYAMAPAGSSTPVAGICHARGMNADVPAVWLPYFIVADLDAAVAQVIARGGAVLRAAPAKGTSPHRFAVIRDPAGASCALYEAQGG